MVNSDPKIAKREARRAAALRANLLRRKQQARQRKENTRSQAEYDQSEEKQDHPQINSDYK